MHSMRGVDGACTEGIGNKLRYVSDFSCRGLGVGPGLKGGRMLIFGTPCFVEELGLGVVNLM